MPVAARRHSANCIGITMRNRDRPRPGYTHVTGRNSTERSRLCRQRHRAGLVRRTIEVDDVLLCEWLVAGGVLNPLDTDQPDKVDAALERALSLLIAGPNQS